MLDTAPKIVTAFGVGQREAKLVITNRDYPPLEAGQRYKLVRAEDGLSLRLLPERCGSLDRFYMEKECGEIFEILKKRYPKYEKDTRVLQQIMESSYLYTWTKRMIRMLEIEVEDMQPLFALYPEEIKEFNSVMEEMKRM